MDVHLLDELDGKENFLTIEWTFDRFDRKLLFSNFFPLFFFLLSPCAH
jgi:hypothetical protein